MLSIDELGEPAELTEGRVYLGLVAWPNLTYLIVRYSFKRNIAWPELAGSLLEVSCGSPDKSVAAIVPLLGTEISGDWDALEP